MEHGLGISPNTLAYLVLSDRLQLDRQLGDVCVDFLKRTNTPTGEVWCCDGCTGDLMKVLGDVAAAQCDGCRIVTQMYVLVEKQSPICLIRCRKQ